MSTSNTPNTTIPSPAADSAAAELHDLGRTRFDHDTAAPSDRDTALMLSPSHSALLLRTGQAPRGLEAQVHAWTTFQFTTDDVDPAEELKGDLHGGQLHRVNRAARREDLGLGMGGGRRGSSGGTAGEENALCAGRKTEGEGAPPLAKGMAEEMDKGMFWNERIV